MRQLQKGEVEIGMVVEFTRPNNEIVRGEVVRLYDQLNTEDKGFDIEYDAGYITFSTESWRHKHVHLVEDLPTTGEVITQGAVKSAGGNKWTDKHYHFDYNLTPKDIETGSIRVDAYFVNRMWKLNQADDTGVAFHCLKCLTRLANNKNPKEREIKALYGQIKRWAELENVDLGD